MLRTLMTRLERLEGAIQASGQTIHVELPPDGMAEAEWPAWAAEARARHPAGDRVLLVRFVTPRHGGTLRAGHA
ncbi:hypothetical protein [Muricoccus radiodurans]|uniref:hypothetical protein n=1 Tax=Muricoccus radiodurans TaxID=2231721 RepID=UPI003CF6ADD8